MTYVVTESCIKCKYTDCVDVCPVDCFHEGENFLVIDPEECIDCSLCVAECPAEAIFAEDDCPEDQRHFLELNAELAKKWKVIIERKEAPADADDWESVLREARAVRKAVGICDVSTLGKIDVQGRDAALFLDRLYTNSFSNLPVGRAR